MNAFSADMIRVHDATKTTLTPFDCDALHNRAHEAGLGAVSRLTVTPMIVTEHMNPLDDSSAPVKKYFVEDGVCGFAWINIKPANCAFAKWLKSKNLARPDSYEGGITVWVHAFNQSMQKKETYAHAFAKVLRAAGIRAHASSRMD